MKQFTAAVRDARALSDDLLLVTLASDDLPQLRAGQLILVRASVAHEPYVRDAFFAIPSANGYEIIMRRGDLSSRPYAIDDTLDIIAPVGNGFTLAAHTRRLLLVGEAAQLAPLIALAHEATRKQIAVTLLVHTSAETEATNDGARRVLAQLLPLDVEYQFVLDIASDLLQWPDQLCAAGSRALYAQLRQQLAHAKLMTPADFAQVIIAPPMACGFGACLACAVETTRGTQLACVDGPVFDLFESLLVG